jgi:hypothetical protein
MYVWLFLRVYVKRHVIYIAFFLLEAGADVPPPSPLQPPPPPTLSAENDSRSEKVPSPQQILAAK